MDPYVSSHAASLLAGLNLQRERVQFCDCLVRQRQSPGQFYPAHRCVLAASSPVLASILSSTGTLVELQAPCLSDSVLAHLFDYIYTGTLPYLCSQQQYYSLLAAAYYLQMDGLQEALRAWQQTEANDGDNTNTSAGPETLQYKDIANTTFGEFPPLSPSMDAFRQPAETSPHSVSSPERDDFSANVEMRSDAQTLSANRSSCIKDGEKHTCRSSSINDATSCSRKDARALSDVNTICSRSESTVNNGCLQVTDITSQNLIQNSVGEVQGVSRVGQDWQKGPFPSAGKVNPQTWKMSKMEELFRTGSYSCGVAVQERENSRVEKTQHLYLTVKVKAEDKQTNTKDDENRQSPLPRLSSSSVSVYTSYSSPPQSSVSSSSTSLRPRCGAVPVICHSSRAALTKVAEVSTKPPYHPVSQASPSSSRAPVSQSMCTDNDSIVKGISTQYRNCNEEQHQDYRHNRDHFCAQNWDDEDSSGQCALQDLCYKSISDRSNVPKQDYNSSTTNRRIIQNDKRTSNGLSHVKWGIVSDSHGHYDSFQSENNKKRLRDESPPQNNKRLQYRTDGSLEDFPSKHQRLEYNECKDISMATASKGSIHSQVQRTVAPLSAEESYTGREFNYENMCPKSKVKEEHNCTCWKGYSHCNVHESKTDLYQKGGVYLPVSTTQESGLDNVRLGFCAIEKCTSLEPENMSNSETIESHTSFSMPAESNMSYPVYSVVGQSYRGHLRYHCLSQEYTQMSLRQSGYKQSSPDHPDHSDQPSDEKEAASFASSGLSPLRQHSATVSKDVLLLDISTKPAELLLSYEHRSGEGEDVVAFGKKGTFGATAGNEQWDRGTFGADENKNITDRTNLEPDSCDKAESKAWIPETNAEQRKSVGKSQHRSGGEIIHKAGSWVSHSLYGGTGRQTNTVKCGTSASVSVPVQASMSSTLSVYIPSTLSATMPTNISAHLSTPDHHLFQCSLCDRCFSQRGSLNRHVRSHLGVRPFPCPQCPMTFSRQYRVTEHMRVHQRCALESDFQKPTV